MFDAIGEGHKIMRRSVSHEEALWEAYDADSMQAVSDVLELTRQVNELEDKVRELERRCKWLEGHLNLKNANIADLKEQVKTLAKWHTRSNNCPYSDDHDCPRLHNGMCFASDDIMCECWIKAAKEGISNVQ